MKDDLRRTRNFLRKCSFCKKEFKSHCENCLYCSPRCRGVSWWRKKTGWTPRSERECDFCGKRYISKKGSKTCSRKCNNRLWVSFNREKNSKRKNDWRKNNLDRVHDSWSKNYYKDIKKSRLNRLLVFHKRRTLQKEGTLTVEQWKEIVKSQEGRCWWCGKGTPLTMDHLIPVSKGGKHIFENVLGACRSCNSSKNNRLWKKEDGVLYKEKQKLTEKRPVAKQELFSFLI